jgi:hypothetical protein
VTNSPPAAQVDPFVYIDDATLAYATPDERALYNAQLEAIALQDAQVDTVDGWRPWLLAIFPDQCQYGFAPHHEDLWRWVWAIEPKARPTPFVAVWARGGAKSSTAEMALAVLGCHKKRSYAVYCSGTQALADEHVANVATLLESNTVARRYPQMAQRQVGKFGNPRGWRRNRLATAAGFTLDALGLDVASRGVKFDDQRPDLIILDDIDDSEDTPKTVEHKLSRLTRSLLPAGSDDVAVLLIQNLIHREGIVTGILERTVDMLATRTISGPIPALAGCKIVNDQGRNVIVEGEPTWEGQSVESCQADLELYGLASFLSECQHDVTVRDGTLWTPELIGLHRAVRAPALASIVVAVDPPGGRAEAGIVVVGIEAGPADPGRLHAYVLEDCSMTGPPEEWGAQAVAAYHRHGAHYIVGEANFGADMVRSIVNMTDPSIRFKEVRAGKGQSKWARAEPVSALYGQGRVHHVGFFAELEHQMSHWVEGDAVSPDRMDALVWGVSFLMPDLSLAPARAWSPAGVQLARGPGHLSRFR